MQGTQEIYNQSFICDCYRCELKELFYRNVTDLEVKSICEQKFESFYQKGDIIVCQKLNSSLKIFLLIKNRVTKNPINSVGI